MQGAMRTGGPERLEIDRGHPTIPAIRMRCRPTLAEAVGGAAAIGA
jgi:hypothetical protein